jgi:hypothetical protein
VARHARDGGTRARALARLHDAEELLAVSLKAEHTDVAVAALERVGDTDGLSAIAQRGRNKVAARRARVRLRQIEEAVTPAAEVPAAQMSVEDRDRAGQLLREAEALVALADPAETEAELARVRLAWAELGADTEIEAALGERFESASEAAREAISERQLERAAEQIRAEAAAREQADRLRVVQEIEELEGAGAEDRIAELKVRWDALPPIPQEYAASLTRRFQDACRAFEARERRRMLAQAAAGRLQTLAAELEQLVASDVTPQELIARWRGLRRDAEVLREHAEANPDAADRLERAIAVIEEKEQQLVEIRQKQEQDNLRRLHQICRQVETLAASDQITLKAGDRASPRSARRSKAVCRCRPRRIGRKCRRGSKPCAPSWGRACRSCATPTSGSAGPTCRCRKSWPRRWSRWPRSRTSRWRPAACASCRAAGSRWRWRRARRAKRCGAASRRRRTRCSPARRRI